MKKLMVVICSLILILGLAGSVSALTLDNVYGDWLSNTGGVDVNLQSDVAIGYGNGLEDQIRWGQPYIPDNPGVLQSGLGFTGLVGPGTSPLTFELDELFEIGQLQHYNYTIWPGTAASAAELQITMDFSDPNLPGTTNTFSFAIDETPNAPGPPDSDDIIDFPSGFTTDYFTIDGIDYTLQLIGFGDDPFNLVNKFISPENQQNTALLWGKITEVPEPASIFLMGFGLLGLMGCVRRRSRKS